MAIKGLAQKYQKKCDLSTWMAWSFSFQAIFNYYNTKSHNQGILNQGLLGVGPLGVRGVVLHYW